MSIGRIRGNPVYTIHVIINEVRLTIEIMNIITIMITSIIYLPPEKIRKEGK